MSTCSARGATSRRLVSAVLIATAIAAASCGGAASPSASVGPSASSASSAAPGSLAPSTSPTFSASTSPTARPSAQALLDAAREAYGAPGALLLVERDGSKTWAASGVAAVSGPSITPSTRFRIASITKPITAALVVEAAGRGLLKLDDVVGDILPGVLRASPPVTVRQLLAHTSGIYDESNGARTQADLEADVKAIADPAIRKEAAATLQRVLAGEKVIASARVIVALSETHSRYFAPGAGYHYSNTNFQVAAMVLEKVTGQSLASLLKQRLVAPLGLAHTTLAPPDLSTPELHGYAMSAAGALVDISDELGWFGNGGNGGIIATADDLNTALRSIVLGPFLTPALRKEMLVSNGGHGLGIGVYPLSCGSFWGHQGGVNGTASIALVSDDGKMSLVAAMNLRKDPDPDLVGLASDVLCRR